MPYNFIEIDKNEQRCDYVRILQMKQDKPVRHTLDCASAITSYLTLHQIHRNRFGLASEIHQNITQLIFTIMRHRSQHSFPLNRINSFISALPFQFLFLVKWNDIFQRLSSKKCKWLSLKIDFFFFITAARYFYVVLFAHFFGCDVEHKRYQMVSTMSHEVMMLMILWILNANVPYLIFDLAIFCCRDSLWL